MFFTEAGFFRLSFFTPFRIALWMQASRKWWPDSLFFLSCFMFAVETYRSPVETLCTNIDYFIPDDKGATKTFSEDAMARLRTFLFVFCTLCREIPLCNFYVYDLTADMGRAMIALFIVSFFFDFVAFWTGVVGCWRRGAGNITSTAILMLLACELFRDSFRIAHSIDTVMHCVAQACSAPAAWGYGTAWSSTKTRNWWASASSSAQR